MDDGLSFKPSSKARGPVIPITGPVARRSGGGDKAAGAPRPLSSLGQGRGREDQRNRPRLWSTSLSPSRPSPILSARMTGSFLPPLP